jgi:hypothetical protein
VHNNPVSGIDRLGLYDQMVHYYMTYFLALVAGLPQDTARTMAIAAQYVDENPLTKPTKEILGITYGANTPALPLYHFALDQNGLMYGEPTNDPLRRFYNPQSVQLSNLFQSADKAILAELWERLNPGACPAPWTIDDARHQLYGEYVHAYEDTFSHRDMFNMPYAIATNLQNNPPAVLGGHTGLYDHNPLEYEQPDRTYNQDEDDRPAQCQIQYVLGGESVEEGLSEDACEAIGRQSNVATVTYIPRPSKCVYVYFRHREDLLGTTAVERDLTESQCQAHARALDAVETHFLPQGDLWAYNELRTLRMEYEIFNKFRADFQAEIDANRTRLGASLPIIGWNELAGRQWDDQDPSANARIGLSQTYEAWQTANGLSDLNSVLQRYNASEGSEASRLRILNDWLAQKGFTDEYGRKLSIEVASIVADHGAENRQHYIGWISPNSLMGVLLPGQQ